MWRKVVPAIDVANASCSNVTAAAGGLKLNVGSWGGKNMRAEKDGHGRISLERSHSVQQTG